MEYSRKKLKAFIDSSQTFAGFTFRGYYTMNSDNFLDMFSHYIETGESYLDEYSEMFGLSWRRDHSFLDFEYFDEDKREKIKNWLNGKSFWDFRTFVQTGRIKEIEEDIILSKAYDINRDTYKYKRKQASTHIAKTSVRKRIFDKHGEVCAECGSKKNIGIDHIFPVVKGGSNEDDNLRPLCKSCNSSKGGR